MQPHQVRWIERHLSDNEIRFVVIGGAAVQFHCPARKAEDIDLFIGSERDVIERLVASLPQLAENPKSIDDLLDDSIGHLNVGGQINIDILTFAPKIDFEEAYLSSVAHLQQNFSFHILSMPLLIKYKKAIGQPKDLEDVKLLEEALKNQA
jgi:hypothetical protein